MLEGLLLKDWAARPEYRAPIETAELSSSSVVSPMSLNWQRPGGPPSLPTVTGGGFGGLSGKGSVHAGWELIKRDAETDISLKSREKKHTVWTLSVIK